ncbi:hypothetical protein [Helicobacter sp. 23-1045]
MSECEFSWQSIKILRFAQKSQNLPLFRHCEAHEAKRVQRSNPQKNQYPKSKTMQIHCK